jgi:RimJ/RimL family protein N-acetyltransferase
MVFAVRPHVSGMVTGWLSFLEIRPADANIEIGHIWFSPALQRTRGATEAIALLMRHAMDDLGYRRLVWKCHALNAASRRAADRLGFVYEGTHRNHRIIKGRSRDTAWYSITDEEWPLRRAALALWLDDANFDHTGTARRSLGEIRASLGAEA